MVGEMHQIPVGMQVAEPTVQIRRNRADEHAGEDLLDQDADAETARALYAERLHHQPAPTSTTPEDPATKQQE